MTQVSREAMVQIRNLQFRYESGEFGFEIDELDLAQGESVACIGPSGSGKTTLINLMTGILPARADLLQLAGRDMVASSDGVRRAIRIREVGMVFQQFELLDYLSAYENILLAYHLGTELELNSEVKERARSIAARMGIESLLRRRPERLSQGERQRVAIARALVTEPKILIADEPTGNLDPRNAETILDLLFQHSEDSGATLLVVTHDHALLPRFERVIDMRELVAKGRAGDERASESESGSRSETPR